MLFWLVAILPTLALTIGLWTPINLWKTDRIRTYIPAHIPTISSRSRTEDEFKLQMPSIVGLQSSYLTLCVDVYLLVAYLNCCARLIVQDLHPYIHQHQKLLFKTSNNIPLLSIQRCGYRLLGSYFLCIFYNSNRTAQGGAHFTAFGWQGPALLGLRGYAVRSLK